MGRPEIQALFAHRISSPRYVSPITTEAVESQVQVGTARLLAPVVKRSTGTIRWTGNLAADTYDLAVIRHGGRWIAVLSRAAARSYRLKGKRGEGMRVRVRAWNVDGAPGPWSAVRILRFR